MHETRPITAGDIRRTDNREGVTSSDGCVHTRVCVLAPQLRSRTQEDRIWLDIVATSREKGVEGEEGRKGGSRSCHRQQVGQRNAFVRVHRHSRGITNEARRITAVSGVR